MEIYADRGGGAVVLGAREGVVRFYGCNFRCPFCPGQEHSYSGRFGSTEFVMDEHSKLQLSSRELAECLASFLEEHPEVRRLLLTGGEPIQSRQAAGELVEMLLELDRLTGGDREVEVVCRTNGHYLGRKGVPGFFSTLKELDSLQVTFEIHLMGTCEEEFAVLSGIDGRYFNCQLACYWHLGSVRSDRVEVKAALGTGHSPGGIQFVHPRTRESMFRRACWSRDFEDIYHDTAGAGRMKAYCLEDTRTDAIYRCLITRCIACRAGSCAGMVEAQKRYGVELPSDRNRKDYREDYEEFTELFKPAQ